MKYYYEALNPESFQKLVQALIVAEYPGVQCYPVGQADGGRDALLYHIESNKLGFIVFQVKFSRDPSTSSERTQVRSLISSEERKIKRLVERGATRYIVVTNVSGTGSLDKGSIDAIHKQLTGKFNIPAQVWWRDDLDSRMDNSTDVKWSYPEVCRATDILGFLIKGREEINGMGTRPLSRATWLSNMEWIGT